MNPAPLTRADGTIHAYACGACGHVSVPFRRNGMWDTECVELTREEAEACCVCASCKTPLTNGDRQCDACSQRQREEWQAKNTATAFREAASFAEAEADHIDARTFTLDNGRTGRVYLCDEAHGFYNAFARLDPTEDDPAPPAESVTLQRRDASAVLEAVDAVCRTYDAGIERMEKIA